MAESCVNRHLVNSFGMLKLVAFLDTESVVTLLMLTWYRTFDDWEQSRRLDPADRAKWARRSEMELSHWAEAARLDY